MSFQTSFPTVTLHFPNPELANVFKSWLCELGDQYFSDYLEAQTDYELSKSDYENPGGSVVRFEFKNTTTNNDQEDDGA